MRNDFSSPKIIAQCGSSIQYTQKENIQLVMHLWLVSVISKVISKIQIFSPIEIRIII